MFLRDTRPGAHIVVGRAAQQQDVFARKKRHADIRETQYGTGAMLIVVTDACGVPLAGRIASVPVGSPAHGVDARATNFSSIRPRLLADEAKTVFLRQGGRQRSPSAAAEEARDAVNLPSSVKSQKADAAESSFAPPLPPPDDHRTDCGLAQNLRMLVVRYEHEAKIFQAFPKVAYLMITLRRFETRFRASFLES